jgi:hypothetical protein
MPRSKLGFWIVTALAVIIPTALAFVLIRAGGFAGVALLAVLVGAFVLARIAFTRRFTPDLQPRRQPPPERELIAHARRPTLMIGLGILAITLTLMVAIGLTGAGRFSQLAALTPTPDLTQSGADATPIVSQPTGLLAGFALPVATAVLGTVGLVVLIIATRRTNRRILVPADDAPPDAPDVSQPDESLDWAELLDGGEDDSDLSLWVDSLSRDDRKR